jgi:hypothetical protein
MGDDKEQSFACKEQGCSGTVTYRREVVKVYRGTASAKPQEGQRIIRVYLKCDPQKHEHEYAVRV